MKKLYRIKEDFYYGEITGLFIEEDFVVDTYLNQEVDMGSVLGKHSEVFFSFDREHIEVISEDPDMITRLEETFGSKSLCGYNPIEILKEREECE